MILRIVSEMLRGHLIDDMLWVAALGKNVVKFFVVTRRRQVKANTVVQAAEKALVCSAALDHIFYRIFDQS